MRILCSLGIHAMRNWKCYVLPDNDIVCFCECNFCDHTEARTVKGKYRCGAQQAGLK